MLPLPARNLLRSPRPQLLRQELLGITTTIGRSYALFADPRVIRTLLPSPHAIRIYATLCSLASTKDRSSQTNIDLSRFREDSYKPHRVLFRAPSLGRRSLSASLSAADRRGQSWIRLAVEAIHTGFGAAAAHRSRVVGHFCLPCQAATSPPLADFDAALTTLFLLR